MKQIIKQFIPKFYIRTINLCSMLFPKSVNKCIVFDGFKKPYVCTANAIRCNMDFKQICI